jgi:hypothetical protein
VVSDSAFALDFAPMRLITLLNHCQHFPGFVYEKARLCPESSTIEIHVRPRRGSKPVCSGSHKPAAGYDQLSIRRFEFVPGASWCCYFTACGGSIAGPAACGLKNCHGRSANIS